MPFPVSVRFANCIPAQPTPSSGPEGSVAALITALRLEGAERIDQQDGIIRFRLPLLRRQAGPGHWHALAYATAGNVRLEHRGERLCLSGELRLGLLWLPVLAIPLLRVVLGWSWVAAGSFVAVASTAGYLVCWITAASWAAELLRQIEGAPLQSARVAT